LGGRAINFTKFFVLKSGLFAVKNMTCQQYDACAIG